MSKQLDIISIPHPTLRNHALAVEHVDKKLIEFIQNLGVTLDATRKPRGVGLAAPQVDKLWRVFVTNLPPVRDPNSHAHELRAFINPVIVSTSRGQTLGQDSSDPDLEGCLSIPGVYGPVPRWEWVNLEYQIIENDTLVERSERFAAFPARVIQHEIDHLDGILFTDYILQYELPLYRHGDNGKGFVEVDPALIAGI